MTHEQPNLLPDMPEVTELDKPALKSKRVAERRPMTPDERDVVQCLQCVRYPVASWDKRFAHSLSGMTTITDKEAPQVWRLFKKYRRQITHPYKVRLLRTAEELAAPDLRKLAALKREHDRLDAYRKRYEHAMNPPPQ